MSVMRGASLRTLPLELGMRAATAIGEKYITTVAAPVVGVVQTGVKRVEPMVMSQNPRAMAAIRAGASEGLVMAEDRYAPIRHATWDSLYETSITDSPPEMVGSDDGPEHPFPIHMHGKVAKGTGRSRADTGFPTANLVGVPGNLLLRLGGVYVGWAAVSDQGRSYSERRDLHKAIVVVGPPMYGPVQVAAKNTAVAHLIQESGDPMPDMLDARIDIIIMAHLRPLLPRDPPPPPTRITAVMRENISVAIASLSRDTWHHRHQKHLLEAASVRNPLVKALKTHKSLGDFAAHASAGLQRRVDSVPLHWAGIRTEGSELKDHTYGTGGFYIKR
ncbi:uncharacterized protein B0I36DRAFT_312390 [Microdochium trichocladiopsis]|uniref:Riboflavin kinase n=1 Tax=Microdochium trichocladiopsis TaxID=1682393 RepID=A0A9P9C0L3_9PEZI|nr:uncharacterized protein B0I36DRAFT_312390 [Microdochium trichocladiopsis]KAH7041219.1 hypothetical protein B0I36DRAFT_312390 [Microdochium trichocladiopsis]